MQLINPEKVSHYYKATDQGIVPFYEMLGKNGKMRAPTVADAREFGLLVSISRIASMLPKPALNAWLQSQAIISALTLPRLPGEAVDVFAKRVVEDMEAQSQVAMQFGTRLHAQIEKELLSIESYYNGSEPYCPPELEPFMVNVRQWLVANVSRTIGVEQIVGDVRLGIGGKLDLLCELNMPGNPMAVVDFKGLAVTTALPCPGGWTTMGGVKVGDALFGSSGQTVVVTDKSCVSHRPCYRITFDDGSEVIADNVHLWSVVLVEKGKRKQAVMSTEDLWALVSHKKRDHHVVIPNSKALELPAVKLPIDPYLFGFWLGDGDKSQALITVGTHKEKIVDYVKSLGLKITHPKTDKAPRFYILGMSKTLKDMGLALGREKFIPNNYLRASKEQRLALLRGLMDSDGHWNHKRNQAVFGNTNRTIAEGVYELVVSLGWRASFHQVKSFGFGVDCISYTVPFTPIGQNPFSLNQRNAPLAGARLTGTAWSFRRLIKKIEPVDSVPTQCIQVDAADSLFLCGKQMVPTHNTQGIKNGKPGWYPEFPLQLAGYAQCVKQKGSYEIWPQLISVVVDSKTPGPVHMKNWGDPESYWEVFLHCLEIFCYVNNYRPGKI